MAVRTVVFPVAGLGTRMLPATKAFPKELLPLVDRPVIQYGVDEAVAAGISQVVLVANPGTTLTERYFARDPALEAWLDRRGKHDPLETVRTLAGGASLETVSQDEPLGLGHAVLMARELCGDDAFAIALPDDVIDATPSALAQMVQVFEAQGGPVVLVQRVPHEAVHRYGVIAGEPVGDGVYRVTDMVEKPTAAEAPSDLAIVGRYVMTPDLFPILQETGEGAGGEIQLTDALKTLLSRRPVFACELPDAVRHDVGTPQGYVQAAVYFALQRPELRADLTRYLSTLDLGRE